MDLWNSDEPITSYTDSIEIPRWIDQKITPATIAAILQGGCDSGAYMPAVTYYQALKTMDEYGDTKDGVLDYLESSLGYIPTDIVYKGQSWGGMACRLVSQAVELWAMSIEQELLDLTS
jgi:hypothetical protein|tara:strand:- start:444 stop:800 length:357 start_codon:yes stop_codon:yes gene_type:complete